MILTIPILHSKIKRFIKLKNWVTNPMVTNIEKLNVLKSKYGKEEVKNVYDPIVSKWRRDKGIIIE